MTRPAHLGQPGVDERAAPTVGDVACGRSGDKGSTLDLAVVAVDPAAFARLAELLTADAVAARIGAPTALRYLVPGLLALKFVLPGALDAGPLASRRAGVHWQKAAISALLSMPLSDPTSLAGHAAGPRAGEA